jgi:hypothetical protein
VIFTFYSYKGGVGRSMALAAVAHLLARSGLKVLAVDFDLEAPGLENYFFDASQSLARKRERGLIDLINAYRRALTNEADFERAEFKRLDQFTIEAIVEAGLRGGSVELMTAGQRQPVERMREYAQTVRNFNWQDFFYNWKGDRFFAWLADRWNDPRAGYDVVLVDSRTGVTEMGGVCAYQLADVAVLLCAPNYQNLEGTRIVAQDFMSEAVKALRPDRPLEILAVPARLDATHPKRDEFLRTFTRELGTEGLPYALAQLGITYNKIALPYLPEFAIEERLAGEELGDALRTQAVAVVFQRLADALTLFAKPDTRLGALRNEALRRLDGDAAGHVPMLEADTSRSSSGFDAFIDVGVRDVEIAATLARQLESRGLSIFFDANEVNRGVRWQQDVEKALDYSANLLLIFGRSSGTEWRAHLTERARRSRNVRIVAVLCGGADPSVLTSFGLEHEQRFELAEHVEPPLLEGLVELLKHRPRTALAPMAEAPAVGTSYPGPHAYSEDDAAFFHGREEETTRLVNTLRTFPVVVLEGAANVGKTSLVCAGLLPRLRRPEREEVLWLVNRVGFVDAAAHALQWPAWLEEHRTGSSDDPGETGADILIVDGVDSFPHANDERARRERFVTIAGIVELAGPRLNILLVWRGTVSDDESPLKSVLPDRLGRVDLKPLWGDELRCAIEQPARVAAHLLENGLAERLIESAGVARSAIYQIQLAFAAIWPQRRRGWVTNKSLDACGHLAGVFIEHRKRALTALSDIEREAAVVLFKTLSILDANQRLARNELPWDVVGSIPLLQKCGAVSLRDRLAADGLIDLWRKTPTDSSGRVFVALVRPNPLQYFDGEGIPDLPMFLWRSSFAADVQKWLSDETALLTAHALEEARHWRDNRGAELTADELRLIERSLDAKEEGERLERKRRQLRLGVVSASAGVWFLFGLAASYFWWQSEQNRKDAESNLQAAQEAVKARSAALDSTNKALELAQAALRETQQFSEELVARPVDASFISEKTREVQAYIDKARTAVATAEACPISPRAYVHIASADDRPVAKNLARIIEQQGYTVPGIQVVSTPRSVSEVRYFRKGEQSGAEKLASALRSAGLPDVRSSYIEGYENSARIRPCHYEVWFAPGIRPGSGASKLPPVVPLSPSK